MEDTDLTQPDHYSQHLSDVNETNDVLATEDIYNSNGMLLVKKGFAIRPEIARKILSHKLVKPLETSVNIEGSLGGFQLYKDMLAMLEQSEEFRNIHFSLGLDTALKRLCAQTAKSSLLMQKVTVLSLQLPHEYQKGLFCAWFAMAVSRELGWPEEDVQASFIAGLVHDAGMLHLDPAILNKKGEYSAEEWRAMQSHTLIGSIFLSYTDDVPALSRRAVKEHHERCNGSGYPSGLFEDSLCLAGQLVAMGDSLYAIQQRGARSLGRLLHIGEILPTLQINGTGFPAEIYTGVVRILKLAPRNAGNIIPVSELSTCVQKLRQELTLLDSSFTAVYDLRDHIQNCKPRHYRTAAIMIEQLWRVVVTSGFISEPLERWLEHMDGDRLATFREEIAELQLMYRELRWQLLQLARVLELAISDNSHGSDLPEKQAIEKALRDLGPLLGQATAG